MEIALNQKRPPDWTASPTQVQECAHNGRGITALPRELVEAIFAHLGGKDLVVCQRVTRRWKEIIDSTPMLPRVFYRCLHPLAPVPELPATMNRYYSPSRWPAIRCWLESFSEQGRKLALELDGLVGGSTRQFPERLFFSLARVLAQAAPVLDCCKVWTINHTKWINQVNFSPDGRYIVTVSDDKTAKVCECIDGKWQEITILTHSSKVYGAQFSPTGDYCLTTCDNATGHIWKVVAGASGQWQSRATFSHFAHSLIATLSFSADGHYLITRPTPNTAQILQLVEQQWQQTTLLRGYRVNDALFHPREHLLVTVQDFLNVHIWRLVDKKWQHDTIFQYPSVVLRLHFSPNGQRLLLISAAPPGENITIADIYNCANGPLRKEATLTLDPQDFYWPHFSPKGDKLVMLPSQPLNDVTIWQFSGGLWQQVMLPQVSHFTKARFSPDGTRLVTATEHNTAILWKEVDGQWQEEITLHFKKGRSDQLIDFYFSPHGHQLVALSRLTGADLWGMVQGKWQKNPWSFLGKLRRGTFSPDGLYFLALTWDHSVNIWTFRQGQRPSVPNTEPHK